MNVAEQHAALQSKIDNVRDLTMQVVRKLSISRGVYANGSSWDFACKILNQQAEKITAYGARAYPLSDKQVAIIENAVAEQQAHIEAIASKAVATIKAQLSQDEIEAIEAEGSGELVNRPVIVGMDEPAPLPEINEKGTLGALEHFLRTDITWLMCITEPMNVRLNQDETWEWAETSPDRGGIVITTPVWASNSREEFKEWQQAVRQIYRKAVLDA